MFGKNRSNCNYLDVEPKGIFGSGNTDKALISSSFYYTVHLFLLPLWASFIHSAFYLLVSVLLSAWFHRIELTDVVFFNLYYCFSSALL